MHYRYFYKNDWIFYVINFDRITGDPQKVEYAKQLVYDLIAEKEMQMFHRGARGSDRGNYSTDSNFSHSSTNNDGVEVW